MDPLKTGASPHKNTQLAHDKMHKTNALLRHTQALASDAQKKLAALSKDHDQTLQTRAQALAKAKAAQQRAAELKHRVDECILEINKQKNNNIQARRAYINKLITRCDKPNCTVENQLKETFLEDQEAFMQAREQWEMATQHYQQALERHQHAADDLIYLKQKLDDIHVSHENITLNYQYLSDNVCALQEHFECTQAAYHQSLLTGSGDADSKSHSLSASGSTPSVNLSLPHHRPTHNVGTHSRGHSSELSQHRFDESIHAQYRSPNDTHSMGMNSTRSPHKSSPVKTNNLLSATLEWRHGPHQAFQSR